MSLEAILIISCIDKSEESDVAVVDIPGSLLTSDTDEIVHMMLRGRLSELTAQLYPSIYQKYVRVENGKTVLYVQLKNDLYGTLRSALIFYQKLLKDMDSKGFDLNLYDPCVVKKMVNGKQMMIV